MPNYTSPGNIYGRIAFLNSTPGACETDRSSGNEYVLEDTFNSLKTFAELMSNVVYRIVSVINLE